MVRFYFSFFVVLIVDRVYVSIERAYKRALSSSSSSSSSRA